MTFVVVGIAAVATAVVAEPEGVAHLMAHSFGRRIDVVSVGAVVAVEHQTDIIGIPVEAA